MVAQLATIEAIAEGLEALVAETCRARSRDGGDLGATGCLAADAVEALRKKLIPRAALITPNLPEAAALLDEPVATSEAEIADQGRRLLALGCPAVLIKGGHGQGSESTDYFVTASRVIALPAPRIATQNTHGTGCSLSSAIAAGLAKGEDMETAVRNAKAWVSAAIAAADRFSGRSRPRTDPSFPPVLLGSALRAMERFRAALSRRTFRSAHALSRPGSRKAVA